MNNAMEALKPSWDATCEASLSEAWKRVREEWRVAYPSTRESIAARWNARLDRLYNNTAMPEKTFQKFVRLADAQFIEKAAAQ